VGRAIRYILPLLDIITFNTEKNATVPPKNMLRFYELVFFPFAPWATPRTSNKTLGIAGTGLFDTQRSTETYDMHTL